MKVGGYPEAVIEYKNGGDWVTVIEEIMASLEEDFERKEEYQPNLFRNAVTAVSNHIGSPSKLTQLDTTKYHAKNILSALKKWHIVLEVNPAAINPDKDGFFLPKRYLHDIGVVNRKRSLAVPQISMLNTIDQLMRTPLGGLFENAFLIQLLSGESSYYSIGTWKKESSTDIEVDFILDLSEHQLKLPVECKAALKIKRKHYNNIIRYLELTHQKIGILVSAAPFQIINEDPYTIINLPIYLASKNNITEYVKRLLNL